MILVPQKCWYFAILLIMVTRWPTPVPFTSKDRFAYQINGKTTISKEKKINKKYIWVGRLLLVTYSISNKYLFYFQNKHTHFQTSCKHWKHFSKKTNIFVYILTNENHYKDRLNKWPLLQNTFKTTQNTISNKSKWSSK